MSGVELGWLIAGLGLISVFVYLYRVYFANRQKTVLLGEWSMLQCGKTIVYVWVSIELPITDRVTFRFKPKPDSQPYSDRMPYDSGRFMLPICRHPKMLGERRNVQGVLIAGGKVKLSLDL